MHSFIYYKAVKMAMFLRKKLFFNQFKQLHRSAITLNKPTFNPIKESEAFKSVLPEVINSLVTDSKLSQMPEVASWVKQVLEYTVEGGHHSRGLAITSGYQIMENPEDLCEDSMHSARILGWCFEMFQTYMLALDDIIDGSPGRRGKPCWYLQPNVGLSAINDAVLIFQSMVEVLIMYFGGTPAYHDALKFFNETNLHMAMGQCLDGLSAYRKESKNIDAFTMKRYAVMSVFRTSAIGYKLPLNLALLFVKNKNAKTSKETNDICEKFSMLLQIQNDYRDLYVDKTITGKVPTDIQGGKCSWLAIKALQHCNETQRSIFKEHYGSKDPEDVKRIMQLYDELQVPLLYKKYEQSVYQDLVDHIHALPNERMSKYFLHVLATWPYKEGLRS